MMTRGLMLGAALTLAACATGGRNLDDPAVQKLFNMSTPQYYASLTLANRIAQNCARYTYDAALDSALNEARNEVGRGSLAANSQRAGIELETDVSQRSFQVKHGVDITSDDLCAAGDAEVLEGSGISALLIPA
ncbi:hypothetical protein AL073_05660 [Loktanella sp. 1ANDIMAR09]|uniref:Lipoprotein n=1 Tax=Yoonia rosea TaxID=287098 RepID=A0A1R3WS67_9RHOB|nr:hypothetical protein [Yoonia rosea]KQB98357.1 hypothetical protein AL073_05660 [Loktanella sp. 1ANDIMAR09]SIT80739.1 hypothetical protein SAMN05421665_1154 [Yoonia rosea]